ncbi:MAG: hydroxymethylbilane synthase [Nitrospinae bacterium]|nr:hydroxymethylbilane synthase [Nitrospinota bacterium]
MSDIKIGTRGSPLALWQANWVKAQLEQQHPGISVELEIIQTQGDKILDVALAKVGGKGLFVKEIESALLDNSVDIAVHSMKDVPTELPEGLFIACICEREDPRDAFVARQVKSFADLPQRAVVGTSSLRRQTQILHRRPDLKIVPLRGNVGTRIKRMEENNLDAIILAAAGLVRLEQAGLITSYMSVTESLPAVAQGAVGVEARIGDERVLNLIRFLDHHKTRVAVETERAFLTRLEGGCQVPIAGHAVVDGEKVALEGLVGSLDGSVIHRNKAEGKVGAHEDMGRALADDLLKSGAGEILKEAYGK